MQNIETSVRHLHVGDRLTGSGVTILALGQVHSDPAFRFQKRPRYIYQRHVRVRNADGEVSVRTWRANTRMRVERAGV